MLSDTTHTTQIPIYIVNYYESSRITERYCIVFIYAFHYMYLILVNYHLAVNHLLINKLYVLSVIFIYWFFTDWVFSWKKYLTDLWTYDYLFYLIKQLSFYNNYFKWAMNDNNMIHRVANYFVCSLSVIFLFFIFDCCIQNICISIRIIYFL